MPRSGAAADAPPAPAPPPAPVAPWRRALAGIVIAGCLAAQLTAMLRPDWRRWYPFLDYPMYARAFGPGDTVRVLRLRGRSCDAPAAPARPIALRDLGFGDGHDAGQLAAILRDGRAAPAARAMYARLAARRLRPAPCVLELWERRVPITRAGISAAALREARWTPRRGWSVVHPESTFALRTP